MSYRRTAHPPSRTDHDACCRHGTATAPHGRAGERLTVRVDLRAHTLRTVTAATMLLVGRCTLVARVEPAPDAPAATTHATQHPSPHYHPSVATYHTTDGADNR